MHQTIQLIRIKVCRVGLKKFANTSAGLVPRFVGFSCPVLIMIVILDSIAVLPRYKNKSAHQLVGMSETPCAANRKVMLSRFFWIDLFRDLNKLCEEMNLLASVDFDKIEAITPGPHFSINRRGLDAGQFCSC